MGGSSNPIVGSLINGLGTNALAGNDVRKGLMINAALLAGSGGMSALAPTASSAVGATEAASVAANSALPNAAFTGQSIVPAANTAPFAANPIGLPAIGGTSIGGGPSSGMINSSLNTGSEFSRPVTDAFNSLGQFTQQNPVLTQMAFQTANQMMQQPQAQMAPAGQINRGQIQGGDYMSLLNPQQGTVLRPQPISLLG